MSKRTVTGRDQAAPGPPPNPAPLIWELAPEDWREVLASRIEHFGGWDGLVAHEARGALQRAAERPRRGRRRACRAVAPAPDADVAAKAILEWLAGAD